MPGRMHDARVFRNSPLYQRITNAERPLIQEYMHLIGDAAYPLLKNIMTPIRDNGHLTRAEIIYNTKLSTIRSIIERAFGLLKTKFRRLKFLDISNFNLGNQMIAAACVLHNFIIIYDGVNIEDEVVNNNYNANVNIAENFMYDENVQAVEKRSQIVALL